MPNFIKIFTFKYCDSLHSQLSKYEPSDLYVEQRAINVSSYWLTDYLDFFLFFEGDIQLSFDEAVEFIILSYIHH